MVTSLKTWFEIDSGVLTLHFAGTIDLYGAFDVREQFKLLHKKNIQSCMVDMSQVKFVDSSGLGALLHGCTVAGENGIDICFVDAQPQVKNLVTITQLDGQIKFKDTA